MRYKILKNLGVAAAMMASVAATNVHAEDGPTYEGDAASQADWARMLGEAPAATTESVTSQPSVGDFGADKNGNLYLTVGKQTLQEFNGKYTIVGPQDNYYAQEAQTLAVAKAVCDNTPGAKNVHVETTNITPDQATAKAPAFCAEIAKNFPQTVTLADTHQTVTQQNQAVPQTDNLLGTKADVESKQQSKPQTRCPSNTRCGFTP